MYARSLRIGMITLTDGSAARSSTTCRTLAITRERAEHPRAVSTRRDRREDRAGAGGVTAQREGGGLLARGPGREVRDVIGDVVVERDVVGIEGGWRGGRLRSDDAAAAEEGGAGADEGGERGGAAVGGLGVGGFGGEAIDLEGHGL